MPERLEAKTKELMVLETDNEEDKNLRLKGSSAGSERQSNRCKNSIFVSKVK